MDLTNQKFGKWTVLQLSHKKGYNNYWLCKCECGTVRAVKQQSLRSGRSSSCGSCNGEKNIGDRSRKHGDFGTKLYGVWAGMKRRCLNPHTKYYVEYGGRGIKVCDEWLEYVPFKEWALSTGYHEGLTLERKDVNSDYCPDNCCWIPLAEQNNNKRNTRYIEYQNVKYSLKDVSEITGLSLRTIQGRYERGWSPEQIFETPKKKNQY